MQANIETFMKTYSEVDKHEVHNSGRVFIFKLTL